MGNETGMTELPKHQGPAPLAKASEERTVPMWFSKLTPPQAKALRQLLAGARTQERMAEQFRRHFGLPGDFEVSPQQLELAASGALPDPKEYDPRKLDSGSEEIGRSRSCNAAA